MCFEILGFDIILSNKLEPFILEINYTPSFTTDSPLDKHVKKNLILDTVKLLNISEEWKK
jgi:tubulin polyglutamylase TTLL6/13